ncbi:protein kinase [Solwaraspora sp. WMMA2080]|uniref:serine/threonine-protein kinase n=1 Tax=unclassified Solwaraspora TaxID=2627926 RepID=UPI00248CD4E7|nr:MULTISPECIES: serine/threonine protein kinase [unclassified Solwaraspora]WBB97902.1 protein kinase [Solwaraspora sp. WMMA2059]WBC23539.1 protein kinase [Solwaraspora sp. WMMA2080]
MSAVPPQLVADRYRLVEPLGQGGMGRVWKARDEVLHRDVAIKELVPPPGLTDQERREMRERSLREARAIARLNHINVVRVFDVLRTDGDPWIVMEYVPSRSLQDVLAQNGPVPATRAAEIGLGVLGALRSAHLSGVMHRDVKPGNVLLGHDGRVVLTDFGLATVPGDPNVTRTGLVLGSPAYIAPERARTGSAGPEGDLWSLGATLYAAVEGQSPYARQTAIATLSALATEPPPPARRAGPLKPVLAGLLRKDPYTRMKADEAERLLTRAAGRGPRRGRSLLDGVRRPSPYGSREVRPGESRSGIVPGPRGGAPRTPVPSEPVSPPVAPLPSALPVVPGPAKYGPPVTRPTNSADPTRVVPSTDQPAGAATAAAAAAETSVLPTKAGEPPSETTVLPQAERTQVVPGRKETAPDGKTAERSPAAEPAKAAEQPTAAKATEQPVAAKAAEQPVAAKAAEQPTATEQPTVVEPAERPPVEEQPGSAAAAASASDRRNWSAPALLFDRAAQAVRSMTELPRTWLISGVAAVVVLALLVTGALLAAGDEDEPDGQLGTGPAASATPSAPAPTSGAPSAEPSVEPSSPAAETSPEVPAVPPQSDESPQPPDPQSPLPDGWRLHEDQTGFSVPVPEGWSVSRERTRVEFRENGQLGRLIIIDQTDNPKPDPVADWQNQEQARRGTYNNYERVRIEAVDYFLDAADWEFRYTSNQGNRLQVRNRGFVTAPDKAYSIYWSTTAERWQQDLVYFELMASRFQPAAS